MKILIVNTYDRGGAANACLRLHEGLLQEGVDSKVLLLRKNKSLNETFKFEKPYQSKSKIQILKEKGKLFLRVMGIIKTKDSHKQRFLKNRPMGLEMFSFPDSNFDITNSPLYQEADIINLHWVANFLDYESFFRKNTKPVVWTLHDMNPFTGGEHYLEKFLNMDADGYPINRLLTEDEQRVAEHNIIVKQNALQAFSNLTVVAPSQWLFDEAKKSEIFKTKQLHYIPYGVDSIIFKPRDKIYSRDILNLPQDKTVILFVADSISNHRKGYVYLEHALKKLYFNDVVLCAVGSKKSALNSTNKIIELGAIDDERLMSMVYSAADVFVIPSLMDNLPNTVLESLMCGTPVIGFPVGGIPDMIRHGFNGLLTSEINSNSLAESIILYLDAKSDFNKDEIRKDALDKYDLPLQSKKYIDLYRSILKS